MGSVQAGVHLLPVGVHGRILWNDLCKYNSLVDCVFVTFHFTVAVHLEGRQR